MSNPEIMRTEFVVSVENGSDVEWCATLEEAIRVAEAEDEPVIITRRIEYFPNNCIVWATHKSMIEEA